MRTVEAVALPQSLARDGFAAAGARLALALVYLAVIQRGAALAPDIGHGATMGNALGQHRAHGLGEALLLRSSQRAGGTAWIDTGAPQAFVGVAIAHAGNHMLVE